MREDVADNAQAIDWWEDYGFNQNPFSESIQTDFYFNSVEAEQHVDLLQLLARHSYELLIIEGVKGVGKTTLLQQFLGQLEQGMPVCHLNASQEITPDSLISVLSTTFNLPSDNEFPASPRARLNTVLNLINDREERCLMVIDDAHLLSVPALQAVLYLQNQRWHNQVPFSIILFAGSGIEAQLHQAGEQYIEKGMLKTIQLKPFELAETQAYLEHRLHAAGFSGSHFPFSREDIIHIHESSAGVPADINQVAAEILEDELSDSEESPSLSFWETHHSKIIGGSVLTIVVAAMMIFWQIQYDTNQQPATHPIGFQTPGELANVQPAADQSLAIPPKQDNTTVATAVSDRPESSASTTPVTAKANNASDVKPATVVATSAAMPQAAIPKEGASPLVMAENTANLAVENDAVFDTDTTDQSEGTAKAVGTNTAAALQDVDSSVVSETQVKNVPVSMVVKADALSKQPANKANEVAKTTTQIAPQQNLPSPVVKTERVNAGSSVNNTSNVKEKSLDVTKPKVAAKVNAVMNAADAYLLTQPARHYTIQIMGVSQLAKLKKFINSHGLSKQAHYYKTRYKNKDWFVLLYGGYANQAQASAAIKQLPSGVRNQNPWVRSFASVRQSMGHQKG